MVPARPSGRLRAGARLARMALGVLLVAGAAPAAPAQELGARAHDTSQPIEINADSLEVQQDKNIAIFSGDVVAVQGDIRLKANILKVHYRQGEEGTISSIDAFGDVFISSPTETAQGEIGVYDVESGVITLTGSVVLTRGENVIRGERLALDLNTGRSRVDSGGAGPKKRVRAVLRPREKPAEK